MDSRQRLRRRSLWNRDFLLVCIVGFLTNISMQMLNSTLAPFANDLWGSKALGGYLTAAFNVGSIVLAFFSGPLVNRLGRRRCLMASALLFAGPTALCALFPTPGLVIAVRVVEGAAKGVMFVATASIVADITPDERMSEGMGLFGLGSTLAMAVGPLIGLQLSAASYGLMFVVCAALFLAAAVFGFWINYERRAGGGPRPAPQADGEYRGLWRLIEKRALPPALNNTISFGSYACVLVFISVFSQEVLSLSALQICLFYAVAASAMLVVRVFGGPLADRRGPLTVIIPGQISAIVMLFLLAFAAKGNFAVYLLCGALYGVATAAIMPAMNAVAILRSPAGRNGAANASYFFMQDFGILFVSLFFGSVVDGGATPLQGYRHMFLLSAGIGLVSLVMSLFVCRTPAKNRRQR